jgi:probable rRNA maturation factor
VDPDSSPPSRRGRFGAPGLYVAVTDGRGRPVTAGGLGRWLARVAPRRARGEVAIALVSDQRIQELNRAYRRLDTPTDVLSFSAFAPGAAAGKPAVCSLGDIAIATGVARRQAKAAGHSYETELRVLALHGLLHLLGYDHDDPEDTGRMARAEARLRLEGGLHEGLIARSEGGKRLRRTRLKK